MGSGIPKEFGTLSELLYHRYAVLSALHACLDKGIREQGKLFFSVYHSRHKGFLSGKIKISSLNKDEKLKMSLPQCCVYCGATDKLTIDHLLPTRKGGEDVPENYCIAAPHLRNKPWINEKLSAQPASHLPPIGKPSAEGLPAN